MLSIVYVCLIANCVVCKYVVIHTYIYLCACEYACVHVHSNDANDPIYRLLRLTQRLITL